MKRNIHKIISNIFYTFLFLLLCSGSGKQSLFRESISTLCFPHIEISENKEPSTALKANRDQSEISYARNLLAGLPSSQKSHLDFSQEDNNSYTPNLSNNLQVLFNKFSYFSFFFYSNLSSRAPPLFIS